MLTSDLLRVKRQKGMITPRYLDVRGEESRARAEALVELFVSHVGKPRLIIDERVEEAIGFGTDFLIWRGLAKLLYDRSEFEVAAGEEPERIREVVFEEAARAGNPVDGRGRRRVLEQSAQRLGIEVSECEVGLYADLEERQVLQSFRELSAEDLLHRYNLALAQAVLYRAESMRVRMGAQDSKRLRRLFQMLKFHRLMHETSKQGEEVEIRVDGPGSLFKKGRKYGIELAKFLPALLHLKGWAMEAQIDWEGRSFCFQLDETAGLRPTQRARGQWVAEEEKWFEERFEEKADPGWRLDRRGEVVDLGDNEVLVTDYVLTSPEGECVLVEILGFWRKAYLERRVERLKAWRKGPPIVLVVSERLRSERGALVDLGPEVVFFKGVILHEKVLAAAARALDRG